MIDTEYPRALSKRPMDEAEMPLPNDETTPPVKKMYLVFVEADTLNHRSLWER